MMGIRFTRFRSTKPPVLTKTFEFKTKNGKRGVAKRSGGQMLEGEFEVIEVEGLEDFASLLSAATPDVAFAYGIPKTDQVSGKVATRKKATGGQLTRTETDIGYAKDEPGIMFADYDPQTGQSFDEILLILIPSGLCQ